MLETRAIVDGCCLLVVQGALLSAHKSACSKRLDFRILSLEGSKNFLPTENVLMTRSYG